MDSFYAPFIPFPRGGNVAWGAMISWIVWFRWREKPRMFRQLLGLAAALNFALFLLFGLEDEIRNLSLMFVPMYLVFCDSVLRLYSEKAAAQKDRNGAHP
jgi:hypothetical protein